MRTVNINHCAKCLQTLYGYGEIAYAAYETICEFYVCKRYALPVDPDDCAPGTMTLVKFLEMKGYVSALEITKSALAVKPNHHHFRHGKGHFFCKTPAAHWPKFVEVNDGE